MIDDPLDDGHLDLTTACLFEATATRLDVARIDAGMMFPTDKRARRRYFHTSAVEYIWQQPCPGFDRDAFEFAASAVPRAEMDKQSRAKFEEGIVAGFVLSDTIRKIRLGLTEATLESSMKAAAETFRRRRRLSVKTINNSIWPTYRCVSHLWAATWWRLSHQEDVNYPCGRENIRSFLATAEAFRRLGEELRAHKAPRPLLRRGEALCPPFRVTSIDLEFQKPPVAG